VRTGPWPLRRFFYEHRSTSTSIKAGRPHGTIATPAIPRMLPAMSDPRRCTANSRQTGKRCKNASRPGGRVCRYHGGAASQVQKKAAERLRALEHPAIDVLVRFLTPPEEATTRSAMLHPSTVLNAAKIVLHGTEKLDTDIPPDHTLIDVTKLSTPLLRMLQAELRGESLSSDEKRLYARMQEVFAGFVEHVDTQGSHSWPLNASAVRFPTAL
jgi:hypothetical protein